MKKRNGRVFFAMLFTAAALHGGALILVPGISPGARPAEPVSPVRINLSPPLPAPQAPPVPQAPPAPEPRSPAAVEPPLPVPAADSVPEASPEAPMEEASDLPADIPAEGPVAAEREGAGNPVPGLPMPPGAAPVSEGGPRASGALEPPDRRDLLLRYEGTIRTLIDRNKEYPYQARRQDQEGRVGVRFVLSRRGELVGEPVLDKKSRYRLLNASALEAVKRAVPYPPFPPEFPEEELVFSVTLAFSLSGGGF